jgi:hypothetical protein
MKTQNQPVHEVVPADLSERIEEWTLLSLTLDAVQAIELPESDFALTPSSGYAFRRLRLLTLVTYCYATGVYGSENIAARGTEDDILQLLCAGLPPTCQEIRDFRRSHRQLVERSLTETLRLARAFGLRHLSVFSAEHPGGQPGGTASPAESDFERPTRTTERIRPALCLDVMALDD